MLCQSVRGKTICQTRYMVWGTLTQQCGNLRMCIGNHFLDFDLREESIHGSHKTLLLHDHRVTTGLSLVYWHDVNDISWILLYCCIRAKLSTVTCSIRLVVSESIWIEHSCQSIDHVFRIIYANIYIMWTYQESPFVHHLIQWNKRNVTLESKHQI